MSAQSINIEMKFPSVYDNNAGAQLASAARLGSDASKLTLRHCCTIFVITDDDDDGDDDDDIGVNNCKSVPMIQTYVTFPQLEILETNSFGKLHSVYNKKPL